MADLDGLLFRRHLFCGPAGRQLDRTPPGGVFGIIMLLLVLPGCMTLGYAVAGVSEWDDSETLVFDTEPIDLPPHAGHDSQQPQARVIEIPPGSLLHGFSVQLVDANGDTVPRSVLHHAQLLMLTKRELFTPLPLRVVGYAEDSRPFRLPKPFGFEVSESDTLLLSTMLQNPTDRTLKGVRVRLEIAYNPADPDLSFTPAYPFHMHIAGPGEGAAVDLPPGRSEQSWEAKPVVGGRILGFAGHLHRYASLLRFEDVTTGRVLWNVKPRLSFDGRIVSIPRKLFFRNSGPYLDPAHIYRVTVTYDNPTGAVIPAGGMGTVVGAVVPSGPPPRADPSDPAYFADVAEKLGTPIEPGAHHGAAH